MWTQSHVGGKWTRRDGSVVRTMCVHAFSASMLSGQPAGQYNFAVWALSWSGSAFRFSAQSARLEVEERMMPKRQGSGQAGLDSTAVAQATLSPRAVRL